MLPRRLLLLDQVKGDGTLTVEEVASDFDALYVTLSYCWGPDRDQRWIDYVQATQRERTPVELAVMPKTLRDAVATTLALGYRYLWVDCLCILQGDAADWRVESAKMSSIYEGSALTISASDTADCRDGFLGPRDELHRNGIQLHVPTDDSQRGVLRISLHEQRDSFAATVRRGPVSLRAWCLQERRLPSRGVLHMCHAQMVFECVRARHYETEVKPADAFIEDDFQLFHIPRTDSSVMSRGKPTGRVGNVLQWYAIVEDYMSRNITMASDKLVAIAGLAQMANRDLKSRYLAGLWEKQIHVGLCWTIMEDDTRSLKRCEKYRAPSWSWASVDGPVGWMIDGWVQSEDGFLDTAIELLESEIDVDEESPYGEVSGGSILVRGKLMMIDSTVMQENKVLTYPRWMSGATSCVGYYMEDERKTLKGNLCCLKVAVRPFGPGPSIPPTDCVLILEEVDEGTFKRLGYGQVMQTDFFDGSPERTLRLI